MRKFTTREQVNGDFACRNLSVPAYNFYSNTNPLVVYEYEVDDDLKLYAYEYKGRQEGLTFTELDEEFAELGKSIGEGEVMWKFDDVDIFVENYDLRLKKFDIYKGHEYIGSIVVDHETASEHRRKLSEDPRCILQWDDGCDNKVRLDKDSDFYRFWNRD